MARCESCNRFVSYEDEPEVNICSTDISDGTLNVEVEVNLNCNECGSTLKYNSFSITEDVECPECGNNDNLLIVQEDGMGTDRYETKTKTGKAIKNPRYMKKFYGADITIGIQCEECGHTWIFESSVEEQASYFEEA